MSFKIVYEFYQIWQVATALNAERRPFNYPLHLACVHTLPCDVTRDRIV